MLGTVGNACLKDVSIWVRLDFVSCHAVCDCGRRNNVALLVGNFTCEVFLDGVVIDATRIETAPEQLLC
jgi:hypothetical protein